MINAKYDITKKKDALPLASPKRSTIIDNKKAIPEIQAIRSQIRAEFHSANKRECQVMHIA